MKKSTTISQINNNIHLQQEVRILLNSKEVLEAADEIIAEQLEVLNRKSKYCHRTKEIARAFNMRADDLNSFLKDRKVIYKKNGVWTIANELRDAGYTDYFYTFKRYQNGRSGLVPELVWTTEGRWFVMEVIYKDIDLKNKMWKLKMKYERMRNLENEKMRE